ncbi:TadE/TadG family type IV pilus assembly protein [Azohydromonas aeria]|uniref:TadE/TadG family type IV pilus assembly protein n=1 Tax=Azohydromonas aeria TaxID=2590212 RepID=UPI0012F776FF|nr:TadE/TadG family type IV pilus assembly protein [Azohydromonas aeria]
MLLMSRGGCRRARQRGAMAVEFGLGAFLLCTALLGAIEVSRLLWVWNAGAEATRLGARLAAVCSPDENRIKTRMLAQLPPGIVTTNISLTYSNPGGGGGACNANNCRFVSVELQGYTHQLLMPLPTSLGAIAMPSFTTTVPREVMDSGNSPECSS